MPNKRKFVIICGVAGMVGLAAMTVVSTHGNAVTAATVQYNYDSLGRIVQDSYPADAATYSYDAAGNRTQATIQ